MVGVCLIRLRVSMACLCRGNDIIVVLAGSKQRRMVESAVATHTGSMNRDAHRSAGASAAPEPQQSTRQSVQQAQQPSIRAFLGASAPAPMDVVNEAQTRMLQAGVASVEQSLR